MKIKNIKKIDWRAVLTILIVVFFITFSAYNIYYADELNNTNVKTITTKMYVKTELVKEEFSGRVVNDIIYLRIIDSLNKEHLIDSNQCPNAREGDSLLVTVKVGKSKSKYAKDLFKVQHIKKL